MNSQIEIICPKCGKKADFFAETTIHMTRIVPEIDGTVICTHCGLNSKHQFTPKDYYFKVPVGKRYLYARTFENLLSLRKYFAENRRMESDPDLDFPKEFYVNRDKVIEGIDKILKV